MMTTTDESTETLQNSVDALITAYADLLFKYETLHSKINLINEDIESVLKSPGEDLGASLGGIEK